MKVFISWSGETSHKVAMTLRDSLPSIIQVVKPFVSSEDIERGARWFSDIGSELEEVNFGILCITPQNLTAPWILFEAGALSKSVDKSLVSPLLIGVKNSDLEGPLAQFNATSTNQSDVFKLLESINKQLDDRRLSEDRLKAAFRKWWPELDKTLQEHVADASLETSKTEATTRSTPELLEEILVLTRSIARQVTEASSDNYPNVIYKYLIESAERNGSPFIRPILGESIKQYGKFPKAAGLLNLLANIPEDQVNRKDNDTDDDK